MAPAQFIGINNYINLLHDHIFITAVKNNILLVIGSLLAHMPIALLLSHILFRSKRFSKLLQSIYFLPCAICGTAVGIMWAYIYNSQFGLINRILVLLGLGGLQQQWLSNPNTVMFCIIIVVMWQYIGYHMIIQLTAMKNVPTSLYEAAQIDGVSRWQEFTKITFPLIKPILKIDAVLIITGSLKYFDLVYVMTSGGPNHASEVLTTYMFYQGFRVLRFGYSSAIGNVLFALCIVAIVICSIAFKSEEIEY
jgi:raffinose/stachyose/melibiose transport system permease protein